jgi:hypothetical protein
VFPEINTHQENVRVIFGVFISGNGVFEFFVFVKVIFGVFISENDIFEFFVFVKVIFQGLRLQMNLWSQRLVFLSTSESLQTLSYYNVSIKMHIHVHGGLYIYLHKMLGKHQGYGQT